MNDFVERGKFPNESLLLSRDVGTWRLDDDSNDFGWANVTSEVLVPTDDTHAEIQADDGLRLSGSRHELETLLEAGS
ncbi:hypothetical protein GCM10009543_22140 [Leifsonia naganoensis]